jgi:hypothetical protein
VAAVIIPSTVEVIAERAFSFCGSLSSVEFEADSVLQQIESGAFSHTLLSEIALPNSLHFVSGGAFEDCPLSSLSFFPSETLFAVRGQMIEYISGRTLIRYFGSAHTVKISSAVEIIEEGCFSYTELRSVRFGITSALKVIGEGAFAWEMDLKAIVPIPRSVKVLSKSCFYKCESLRSVIFEAGSRLREVSFDAFQQCPCDGRIDLPPSAVRIKPPSPA